MAQPISRRSMLGTALASAVPISFPLTAAAVTPILLDDASRQDATSVFKHFIVKPDKDAAIVASLRAELRDAAQARRPVAFGVARHSMGRQSLAPDGTAITFDAPACLPDLANGIYRARAGTRWRDVIATLDPLGMSPMVMQSNNDFGVVSTFAVNAHGWAVPHGPFGSTVRSLRLMLADGSLVTCSRDENQELFRLSMGGYGLPGIILDLDAEMVANRVLRPSFERMPSTSFGERFVSLCSEPEVAMAYGRLDVAAHNFLGEALMIGYRLAATPVGGLPLAESSGEMSVVSRKVYRAQTGSELGKRARWVMETVVGPDLLEGRSTRNTLLNEPVSNLADDNPQRVDILHEYFIPPGAFAGFIAACREVIPSSHQELLNVTLRYVDADQTSVLAYAQGSRIAAVMSFSQHLTPEADADMREMTRGLIDRVLAIGGSFYLPYRLHARRDQVERAYPALAEFVTAKRRYDPGLLFRNGMWDTWMTEPVAAVQQ